MDTLFRFGLRHAGWFKWLVATIWAVLIVGAFRHWWRPHGSWMFFLFLSIVSVVLFGAWVRWQRERLIRETPLPQFLKRKLRQTYPHLSHKDADLVERGLRQFFMAANRSAGQFVGMPSKVADAMWHEFILHTQAYRDWCALALGRFLHHSPAEVLGQQAKRNDGLRRTWYWACKDEAIDPRKPTRLPLLFALDGKLAIAGGFTYVASSALLAPPQQGDGGDSGVTFSGSDFSDSAAPGDASGFGGADGSGGDGGGDGDGGGCGGGGD